MQTFWHCKHLDRLCPFHFTRCFGYQRAFLSMGAAFVECRPKMPKNEHISRVFGLLLMQFCLFSLTFITLDKTWIQHYTPETKQKPKQWGRSTWKCAEKSENSYVCWKSHSNVFSGLILHGAHRHRLPEKRQDHRWTVLHFTTGPIEEC